MAILAETGCYADLTLPAVPARGQVAKINCLYECSMPLGQRAPHRRGSDLRLGRAPQIFPIMVQGPLGLDFSRRKRILPIPYIENSELTVVRPPTMARLQLWRRAAVTVRGRPDWVFIKLHCHGMDPLHTETVLGSPMSNFLEELFRGSDCGKRYKMHFTTAREMVNIILAACDGRDGNPGDHRDYKLRPMAFPSGTTRGQHEAAHLSSE